MLKRLHLCGNSEVTRGRSAWGNFLRLAAVVSWLAIAIAASAASFTVTVDRDTLTVGESAMVTFKYEDQEPANPPQFPTIANLSVGPASRSEEQYYSFTGGQAVASAHVSYTFEIVPRKAGIYTIPSLSAVIGNQAFASQPIQLKVLERKPGQAGVGGAILKLVVPKNEAYVGEILPVEIQLYCQMAQGLEMPHFNEGGFTLGKLLQPTQAATAINGQRFNVLTFKTFVVPAKVGKLNLGPATMSLQVPRSNARNIFGQYVDWEAITLESEPQALQVNQLPRENVPAGFSGAVGNFSLNVAVSPTNVAVGDPITVKVQISGRGALESLMLPAQTNWSQFKVYPPTSDFQPAADDPLGMSGTRSFALTAVPETMDTRELPPFVFSYFDPDKKNYRTLTQPAVPLIVRPSTASLPPPILANANNASDNPTATPDLTPIKQRLGVVAQIQPPLIERSWFLAAQGIPVLAWLALLIRRKQGERLVNNPRLRREREVERIVREGLKNLRAQAEANETENFFATLFRLLQEQLGERLDLPASAITEAILDERLRPLRVPEEQLDLLRELFHACNQARYARQSTNDELISLIPKMETAMNDLKKINA